MICSAVTEELFRNGAKDAAGTEVYPGCDGKVCLPDANLCANRKNKVSKVKFKTKMS